MRPASLYRLDGRQQQDAGRVEGLRCGRRSHPHVAEKAMRGGRPGEGDAAGCGDTPDREGALGGTLVTASHKAGTTLRGGALNVSSLMQRHENSSLKRRYYCRTAARSLGVGRVGGWQRGTVRQVKITARMSGASGHGIIVDAASAVSMPQGRSPSGTVGMGGTRPSLTTLANGAERIERRGRGGAVSRISTQ